MVHTDLSLIIATADRPDALAVTLRNLAECALPDCAENRLHVIVADNGSDARTAKVCRSSARLQISHLHVSRRGKTIAQNAAVAATDARLLVFTDDDVEFDRHWLVELVEAANRWPDHVLFGGRVLPRWPDGMPTRLEGSRYAGPLYTLLSLGKEEGPIPGFRPFGPNMAVRRTAFERGVRFDETIGPGSAIGVSMGDETQLARQLAAQGETAVYVPTSVVYHRVQRSQLSLRWQLRRGMRYGRMLAYFDDGSSSPRLFGVPRWVYRRVGTSLAASGLAALRGRWRASFDRLMDAAVALGQAGDPR